MALSVKNMLGGSGGGASPFAWGKYTHEIAEKRDSAKNINITRTRTSGGSMNVYYSDSYTYDSDTGIFSLVNPTTVTAYCGSSGWNGLRGKYVIQTLDALNGGTTTSGKVLLLIDANATYTEVSAGVYSETNQQAMYGLNVSACTIVYYGANTDFLEYVTDKNPNKYPNGEIADDGFFYRYANEGLYLWGKFAKSDSTDVINETASTLPYEYFNGYAVVYNGEIHLLGGQATNTNTNHYKWNGSSWVSVSTLPYNFYYGSAVVYNNEIHLLGGGGNDTAHYKWNGSSWVSVGNLPEYFQKGSAVVYNNAIHILGGSGNSRLHYKWNGSSWVSATTLPDSFYQGSAVVYNNAIHILGGNSTTYNHYKWDGSSWTQVSTLPYSFYNGSAVIYNNTIRILGGTGGNTNHYKWDGVTWASVSIVPYAYVTGSAVVYDSELNILGSTSDRRKHIIVEGFGWGFFDNIISDNENAYPNGGKQDGYYYKKASLGIAPEMFGCAKMAIDTLVPTSNIAVTSSNYTVNHSLGEIPKVVLIVANQLPSLSTGFSLIYARSDFANARYGIYMCGNNYSATSNLILQSDITRSTFRIWMQNTRYFVQGVEYSIITMA